MTLTLAPERALDRMRRTAEEGAARGFGGTVVAPSPDFLYLMGYLPPALERPTLLVIAADADPVLVVPELERPLAAASPGGGGIELLGWRDGEDPFALAARRLAGGGRVAVTDRLWAAHLLALEAVLPGATFEAADVVGRIRAVKDADELDALRRAGAAADRTFEDVRRLPFAGRREDEVARDLARLLVEHGHASVDFTIVGSGPNAASPHHEPGERTIAPGDAVVLDFGGLLDGYASDTTRTVVVSEPPDGFEEVYALVRTAQAAGCDAVRPGALAQDVDRAARTVIADGGFADRFVHRTGHGIGLEVHEPPYVVEGNETVLEPGTTFSVEPGIYLEGRFGVRIEDIVAVTADGVERLNTSSRDLQVVS
jgi:D-alanyl-D-alanine dipeptidase